MNDYPHLITCLDVEEDAVVRVVTEQADRGPRVSVERGTDATHITVVVRKNTGEIVVWERHGGLTPPPSRLGVVLAERLPGARLEEKNQAHPGEVPEGQVLARFERRIDDEAQNAAFDAMATAAPERLMAHFPRSGRVTRRTVECPRAWVEWPAPALAEAVFDYRAELFASLLVFDLDGGAYREGDIPVVRFPALTVDTAFKVNGRVKRFAADDLGQQLENMLAHALRFVPRNLDAIGDLRDLDFAALLRD